MEQHIEGKVIVITGASGGLGAATARHLSALGATVVLGARRIERIQSLAEELAGCEGKAIAIQTDVTQSAQVQALVDAAIDRYGRRLCENASLM
ncbi:MAG: SDR family oxidoreductase [Burkholderiales bacterium]